MEIRATLTGTCIACAGMVGTAMAQHDHGDVIIARTAAGQLAVEFENPDEPLGRVDVPAFSGWIGDEPGFESIEEDEPDEDLYMLDPTANIQIEIVNISAGGFAVLPPDFDVAVDDFNTSKLGAGDTLDFGSPAFHVHYLWVVSDTDWDGSTTEFDFQFRVLDRGASAYAASDVYTATFAIPTPGAFGVAMVAALGAARRQRR